MIESYLNPVLVREMRQAVRSRVVVTLIFLYLLLLTGGCFYFLLYESIVYAGVDDSGIGERLSFSILAIAFFTTGLVVLLHTGGRIVFERINEDMMFASTLKPRTIAIGKIECGAVLSILLYSMTLPFLTLAYIMGGVDLFELGIFIIVAFLMIQTLNTMVLAFFAGIKDWIGFSVRLIPFLLCAGIFLFFSLIIASELLPEITRGITRGLDLLFVLTLLFFGFALIPTAMFTLTCCQLAPQSSNRMMPTRIIVSITSILFLIPFFVIQFTEPGFFSHTGLVWVILMMCPFVLFCLIATCERSELGRRIRSGIPFGFWGRVFFFPLYTGDCNAITWLLCGIIIATVAILLGGDVSDYFFLSHGLPICSTIFLSFNYAVISIAIQHSLRRYVAKERTWMILVALLCLGTLLSFTLSGAFLLICFDLNIFWDTEIQDMLIFVPNLFWIYNGCNYDILGMFQLFFAGVWFLFLLPFVGVWIKRRFKKFVVPKGF